VQTEEGGMIRGTIVESVPHEHVLITLTTGEQRRIPWASVRYAGPSEGAPGPSPSNGLVPYEYRGGAAPAPADRARAPVESRERARGAVAATGEVRVRFESPQPGVAFHRVTATAGFGGWGGSLAIHQFERLCAAPCARELRRGSHQFALSLGDGAALPAPAVDIGANGVVTGQYVDRSGLRTAGWLTMGLGIPAGLAAALAPLATTNELSGDANWIGWLTAGASIAVIAAIVGFVLGMQPDGAVIRFD
jgi:hypothetical protein